MSAPSIIDPFHRNLHNQLTAHIDQRMVELANGAANNFDQYSGLVGYLRAMNDVLELCQQIEHNQYGPRPGAESNGET